MWWFFFQLVCYMYGLCWPVLVIIHVWFLSIWAPSRTHCWLIALEAYIFFMLNITRRVPLVEHELLTIPVHLSSPPVFSGVRVTRSLVLCEMLCRSSVVFLSFFCWSLRCLFIDLRILIFKLVFVFCFHFMLVLTWLQCELFVLSVSNLTLSLCSLVDEYCCLK
jgi:hypothetical protein